MSRVSSETLRCNYRKLSRRTWTVDDPLLLTHANPTSRWINALRNRLATSQVPSTRSWMQLDECTGCNWCTGWNRECEPRRFDARKQIGSAVMAEIGDRRRIVPEKETLFSNLSECFTSVWANTPIPWLINRSRKWIAKIDVERYSCENLWMNFLSFFFLFFFW